MDPTKNSIDRSQSLNPCNPQSSVNDSVDTDPPPIYCDEFGKPLCLGKFDDTQARVATDPQASWLQEISPYQKTGFGRGRTCDPMQLGHIVNQTGSRTHIYRYTRAIRGSNEAMLDLFSDITVEDDFGKHHPVPIVWGRQERAVALILQDNVPDDGSLTLDRLRLPMMSINSDDVEFNQEKYIYPKAKNYFRDAQGRPGFVANEGGIERSTVFGVAPGLPITITYTMYAWTRYEEDMHQIIEQVLPKICPLGYISIRGVHWETVVRLDSSAGDMDNEPGDQAERVLKYQWNMTVETYIPQPITRNKAVLNMKTDVALTTTEGDFEEVIDKIEVKVEDDRN